VEWAGRGEHGWQVAQGGLLLGRSAGTVVTLAMVPPPPPADLCKGRAPEATRSAAAEADREAAREGATGSAGGAAAQLGAGAAGDLPYQPPPEPMPAH
jgi:hypothetical protein